MGGYYKESFLNETVTSSWPSSSVQRSRVTPIEYVEMTSYRSQRRNDALTSILIPDITADPYASFLTKSSLRKYDELLRARGLKPEGNPDRGHPFELMRFRPPYPVDYSKYGNVPVVGMVHGIPASGLLPLNDVFISTDMSTPVAYQETGLATFAQQAYVKTAPTNVQFDAALFLGELREGLPRLIPDLLKGKLGVLRSAGSDYLNVQFGWLPLISELKNAASALFQATRQFQNTGTRVHRKLQLPTAISSRSAAYNGVYSVHIGRGGVPLAAYDAAKFVNTSVSSTLGSNLSFYVTKRREVSRWFEGEFSLFLPLGFDPSNFFDRYNELVSLRLTPQVLWELAPWSWLVDWYLRIEDTIAANQIVANDRLVMHYGYAMEKVTYVTYYDRSGGSFSGITPLPPRSGRSVTTYKRRIRANPYGFRVGGASALTGSQLAILGALGLTKLK